MIEIKIMDNRKNNKNPSADEINALLALFNEQKISDAITLALSIAQRYPKHGFAWKVLGAIYQNQGLTDQALEALKKAALYLPDDYEAQYNLGNCYYDQVQLDAATKCYQKAIKLNPRFAQAHYNLGNVFKNKGLLAQSEKSYQYALKLDPHNVWILDNLAHVLYEQAKLVEAKDYYQKVLKLQPNSTSAYIGLGAVAKSQGYLKLAEDRFKKAIELGADFEAYSNLADLFVQTGRLNEAECYMQAGALAHSNSIDVCVKMAAYLRGLGRLTEAIHYFTQALSFDPLRKDVHIDLGLAKSDLGLFGEAEAHCRQALNIDPDYWQGYNNLGLVLHKTGRNQEAEQVFNHAITLNSKEALLYSNLALPLGAMGQIKKAEIALKKAIEILPNFVNAHINLCVNYIAQSRLHEAEHACMEALKYDPLSNLARSNLLFTMNYSGHHSPEYRLQQAIEFDKVVSGKVDCVFSDWHVNACDKRLRVGFISGDLRQHPVAYFLESWLQYIDFSKFELIAYSTDIRDDDFTGKLKPSFSYWKSLVALTDQAAAKMIHDDGIDILFDLSGHTSGNRLQILAWKPAPIQVSWLGYFATTGMKTVDYFIADKVGVPESHQAQFVEKIKYLPYSRLCFTPPDVEVEVSSLPAISNGFITFASFQTLAKAGDDVLAIWADVMLALPNSRLRWQCKSFGDASLVEEVVTKFAKLGLSADRIVLLNSVSRDAYFAAHHEVDIILDTFPYPGGTTTCESLWMGVPTLTLAGDSLIARQGASMLSAVGLVGWIVETKSDYLNKALSLCHDLKQLATLRAKLREQVLTSPLFDAKLFASNIGSMLLDMWYEHYPPVDTTPDKVLPSDDSTQLKKIVNQSLFVYIVSATRFSESDFWSKSALGLSLNRHLKQNSQIATSIAFNNTKGLSDVFNEAIEAVAENAYLVFLHDDVWIDEANFVEKLISGLERFDVIGIAGNKRRLPKQPSWAFIDTQFTWDDAANLSGFVAHGKNAFGHISEYGQVPAECELMDGVFLAVKKSTLINSNVKFDPQFDFHFYDLDFCRSARQAGLTLGTWHINLTHQSGGAFGSEGWFNKYQLYLKKWEASSNTTENVDHELTEAVNDVLDLALEHYNLARFEQAEKLYLEVLAIQPDHLVANHNLALIELETNRADLALARFEKVVKLKPEHELFWVNYIKTLMQQGAVEAAVNALELGQKYGLQGQTAQSLAAWFINKIDG